MPGDEAGEFVEFCGGDGELVSHCMGRGKRGREERYEPLLIAPQSPIFPAFFIVVTVASISSNLSAASQHQLITFLRY